MFKPAAFTSATSAQVRAAFDGSNYTDFTTDSGGDLTIAPTGGNTVITGTLSVSSALSATTGTFTGTVTFTDASIKIIADDTAITLSTSDGADNRKWSIGGGGAATSSRGAFITMAGNEDALTGKLQLVAGNVTGGDIEFYTGPNLRMTVGDGADIAITTPNTVSGTGLMVTTNVGTIQEIMRDSSSMRWKTDIEPTEVDVRAVLGIVPKDYGRRGADGRVTGFIVEDFHDAGFHNIIAYDDEGPAGFLEFGRGITALQQAVLLEHDNRIADLERRLAA